MEIKGCQPAWPKLPASFYKIILPSIILDKKLMIPKKFVETYGDELSSIATLIIPDGCFWQVGLEKAEEMLWFSDGWQKLVDHYSISSGHFLIFKYKGNSSFCVFIFDMTATEIHYLEPCNQAQESDEEEMDSDVSLEILGSSIKCPTCKINTFNAVFDQGNHQLLLNSAAPSKIGMGIDGRGVESHETLKFCCPTNSKRYRKESERVMTKTEKVGMSCEIKLNKIDASMSLQSLLDIKTKNKQLLPEMVGELRADRKMASPSRRHKVQFGGSKHSMTADEIELISPCVPSRKSDSDGQWSVIKDKEAAAKLGIKTCFIDFFMSTKLSTQERERAIDAARMFTSENPSFMAIVRQSNLKKTYLMVVPPKFAASYLHPPEKLELEILDGRRWSIYSLPYGKGAVLSRGWAAFVNENHWAIGDICVFELIQIKHVVLRVSIFRANEDVGKQVVLFGGPP